MVSGEWSLRGAWKILTFAPYGTIFRLLFYKVNMKATAPCRVMGMVDVCVIYNNGTVFPHREMGSFLNKKKAVFRFEKRLFSAGF